MNKSKQNERDDKNRQPMPRGFLRRATHGIGLYLGLLLGFNLCYFY